MFQIIGEKINGTRTAVGQAIAGRDAGFVQALAIRQAEAGAHRIDVNAGTRPDRKPGDLRWLAETVQAAVDVPLCLDSANPAALAAALDVTHTPPLINSVSGEPGRLEGVLPLARDNGCPVIALPLDEAGIPADAAQRLAVIRRLLAATRAAGLPDGDVYVDPLVMAVSTAPQAGAVALEVIAAVRAEFPDAHLIAGLSNVSFGLPARHLVNRTFLALAVAAGLDSAICDPLDRELQATLLAAGSLIEAPFDFMSDTLRGMRGVMLDMLRRPEQLLEAEQRVLDIQLEHALAFARATGLRFSFIPLHRGSDGFMSIPQFERFYWPQLREMQLRLVDAGITPVCFYEGIWNKRLEYLTDLPRGKTIGWFQRSDIFQVKEVAGKTLCIIGGMPNTLLQTGTAEKVRDRTREVCQRAGAGGGFVMSVGIGEMEGCRPDLVETWVEATREFGAV